MKQLLNLVLTATLLVGLALPGFAESASQGKWMGLKLDKAQTERIDNIQKVYWERLKKEREEVMVRMREWLDLYQSKKADEAAIRVRYNRIEEAQKKMHQTHYEYYMALRKTLTPDQYKQLASSKLDRIGRNILLTRHCEICGME